MQKDKDMDPQLEFEAASARDEALNCSVTATELEHDIEMLALDLSDLEVEEGEGIYAMGSEQLMALDLLSLQPLDLKRLDYYISSWFEDNHEIMKWRVEKLLPLVEDSSVSEPCLAASDLEDEA